jgi:hypothetical protein
MPMLVRPCAALTRRQFLTTTAASAALAGGSVAMPYGALWSSSIEPVKT